MGRIRKTEGKEDTGNSLLKISVMNSALLLLNENVL